MRNDQNYDVVVVGGGAAGLSAALTLTRARRRVLVVDARAPRNAPAGHMHGFLSRDGMPPLELLERGREEVLGYGGVIVTDFAEKAERSGGGTFALTLASGCVATGRQLLVATGLTDGLPDVPGLARLWGGDVQACPYCHGWEVRDQPVAEIATGPMSVHHALIVRQWTEDLVFFLHDQPALDPADRLKLVARGIRIVEGRVSGIASEGGRMTAVELADGGVVPRSALFVVPRFELHDSLLTALGVDTDEQTGWPAVVGPGGRTSVPGVWVAGNVADPSATVVMAAGAAALTAGHINAQLVAEETDAAVAAYSGTVAGPAAPPQG